MISEYAEFEYCICSDKLKIYFPKNSYTIQEFKEIYCVIPTGPSCLSYEKEDSIKEKFNQFVQFEELKINKTNGIHGEEILSVDVFVIYDVIGNLVGFAARGWTENKQLEKEIIWDMEL